MSKAAPAGEDADLAAHRAAIDALDREILANLNARARHAQAIGALKEGSSAYRPEREAQVLTALAAGNAGPLPNAAVTGIFRQIMSACLALEQKLKVAYLGPAGTFSHAAVARHFGAFVDAVPLATIDEIFRARGKWPMRLRGGAGRELHRRRSWAHARPHVPDRPVGVRRSEAARAAEPAVQARPRSPA